MKITRIAKIAKIETEAKAGEIKPQPPKDPNSGKMDSQIFIGKEDPQHAKKKKKKKKASIEKEGKYEWPIETHDENGIFQKFKKNEISDKEFVDQMVKVKNITGFPGLTDNAFIRDSVIKTLENFEATGDYESTAKALKSELGADATLERHDANFIAAKRDSIIVEAKLGPYLENTSYWGEWKGKNYFVGDNIPEEAEAQEFNRVILDLINMGGDSFIPRDQAHDPIWKRLQRVQQMLQGGQINNIEASGNFQAALHEAERMGDATWATANHQSAHQKTSFNLHRYTKKGS